MSLLCIAIDRCVVVYDDDDDDAPFHWEDRG